MTAELRIELDGAGIDARTLINEQIVSFIYDESMYGCAAYAMVLRVNSSSHYDTFIRKDGGVGHVFRFRYGFIDSIPDPINTSNLSDWKTLELLYADKNTLGDTVIYTFKGLCHGNALNRHYFKNGLWSNSTVATIISSIVKDAGLNIRIEPTLGEYYITNGSSRSSTFIKNTLLPLAYSSRGNDWRFWIENGDTVIVAPASLSTISGIKLTDNAHAHDADFLQLLGPHIVKDITTQPFNDSGSIEVRYIDPLASNPKSISSKDSLINDNTSKFNYLDKGKPLARETPSRLISTNRNKHRNTSLQTAQAARREGTSRFQRNGQSLYKLVSRVPYTAGLKPGILLSSLIQKTSAIPDINTGTWLLSRVRSISTHGVLKTFIMCEKRWEK